MLWALDSVNYFIYETRSSRKYLNVGYKILHAIYTFYYCVINHKVVVYVCFHHSECINYWGTKIRLQCAWLARANMRTLIAEKTDHHFTKRTDPTFEWPKVRIHDKKEGWIHTKLDLTISDRSPSHTYLPSFTILSI